MGLENMDPETKAYFAVRHSFDLRSIGKLDDSDQVILEAIST